MDYNTMIRKKDKGLQAIISYKINGKWKQKSKQGFEDSRKGKSEAKTWIAETVNSLKNEVKDKNDYIGITYKEFVSDYLDYKKSTISYNTYSFYKKSLEKFEMLNDIKITDITPLHIRKAYEEVKKNSGLNSTKQYYGRLKSLFECAKDDFDLIIKNPCKPIKDKKIRVEKYALTIKEQDELIDNLRTYYNKYVYISSLIALKCGLRHSEILGLTWNDIDMINCELNVNKQWKKIGDNKYGFGETKNKVHRKVPISRDVIKELVRYKVDVPISYDNRIIGTNSLSEQCRRSYRHFGFEISIHNLRHTYTTNLIANGIDFRTTAKLIGDNVEMVMKVYSHVNDDMMAKAKDIINTL